VVVPEGIRPGDKFKFTMPDGRKVAVTVPMGAEAGQSIQVGADGAVVPAPPPAPTPLIVVVPHGVKPGGKFKHTMPNGREVVVTIPPGAGPGQPIQVAPNGASTVVPKFQRPYGKGMSRHAETNDKDAHMHAIKTDPTTPMCRKAWEHGTKRPLDCVGTDPPPSPPPPPPSPPAPPPSPPPPPSPAPPSPSPPMITGPAGHRLTCSATCLQSARPNVNTGQGYFAFSAACLKAKGGLGCVGDSGCRLCSMTKGKPGLYGMCPGCVADHYREKAALCSRVPKPKGC